MGYVDYFLIVWDFIKYARDHDIMVGPGRGSAAGSLVAYTLGITQLDPIRYDLLFERFLNPERVSMPDIDVDFCFERRQEVIEYVRRKYGDDCVVQIVTFGTLAARGVIRDVGRVLDMPYAQVADIAKMIPQELNITIDKALTMNPELKKAYEEQEDIHYLIDMARRLEGLPRHTSMHAAGVVISQKDVSEYVPLSRASDGSIVTQFTMTTLEELGLLKMDFLGLRTLTVIQNAVKLIQKDAGVILDMQKINYDDKKVLDSLGTGRSDGVFQLESAGMKNFMKELKPQSLEDVIAGISLYRPGPMDFIPQYIRGKNRPDTIRYDCPQLEPILKPTYGCIVYQEQVMQIVRNLAGYTLGRSYIYVDDHNHNAFDRCWNGSVVGEFVCDKITWLNHVGFSGLPGIRLVAMRDGCTIDGSFDFSESCLTTPQIEKYLGGKDGYAWHISKLEIYDTPKKLSEFSRPFENCIGKVCDEYGCAYCEYGGNIKRPPQSWCYVEELK